MPTSPLFVLDQNFPTSIVSLIRLPDLLFQPLKDVHPDLVKEHEDWEILRELKVRGGVDGWITLDRGIQHLEKEMVVLHQTRLSLVVFEGVGNDPLVAAGLLMIHARAIARQTDRRRPQLWVLRKPSTKPPSNPWARITELATRLGVSADEVYARNRLPPSLFLRRRGR